MPGFDGTGPLGMGPMTGGGRGVCAIPQPAYPGRAAYPPYGIPYYGAGLAAPGTVPFAPQLSKEQELGFLKDQTEMMKRQLEQIEVRIKELEGESES